MMAMIHKVKDAGMPEILTEKAYLRRVNEKRVASLYETKKSPSRSHTYIICHLVIRKRKPISFKTFSARMTRAKLRDKIQGDPNRNFLFQMDVFLKPNICDPMLVKPKLV